MVDKSLENLKMYKLLLNRKGALAKLLDGELMKMVPHIGKCLEYITVNFPNLTDHGIQHSYRIIDCVYSILNDELKKSLSDMEIFCFIMSALFHDTGLALESIENKEEQRKNHHLYAKQVIEKYVEDSLKGIAECKRICQCVSFVCESHGRDIKELYDDSTFCYEDTIEGQNIKYGLIAILLRVGDLMDMDERRVAQFVIETNPEYYQNKNAINHNKRHLEILNYNYTDEKITVKIETKNRERYLIWQDWLEYLDREVMYANSHYLYDIDKKNKGFRLPGVTYTIMPEKGANFDVEEITFRVDENGNLWEILTNSIYTNEFDYIRELVQNGIDANLLKFYCDVTNQIQYISPRTWGVSEEVRVYYSKEDQLVGVVDQGIGMNKTEIKNYLFKAADSGYKHKNARREFEFPAIAKFGIGFVSCLTKATEIQISSQSSSSERIYAYIRENSNTAFLEKQKVCGQNGTVILMRIKNQYAFNELKDYFVENFCYLSTKLRLIDLDALYCNEYKLNMIGTFEKGSMEGLLKINENIDRLEQNRRNFLKDTFQDENLLFEIGKLLSDETQESVFFEKLDIILKVVFSDSVIKRELTKYFSSKKREKQSIDEIRKLLKVCNKELQKIKKQYPIFIYDIGYQGMESSRDFELLQLEFDDVFNLSKIRSDKKIKVLNRGRGIIYIKTKISNPEIGIEWETMNCFLYNNGEIVKNIIQNFYESDTASQNTFISLSDLEDADYEMNLCYEEENEEEYLFRNQIYYDSFVDDPYQEMTYRYNLVFPQNNNFWLVEDVDVKEMKDSIEEKRREKKNILYRDGLLEGYSGENIYIGESALYQDGIKLDINPQSIVPLGIGWTNVNLTARARFQLNASRHQIDMNRNVIDVWLNKYGTDIQRKIANNCIDIFNKMKLDFKVDTLLYREQPTDYFEKICYENIINILKDIKRS